MLGGNPSGILNINKPAGSTSRLIVNQVQRLGRKLKVGHAGTLDPMATGVLLVCVGAATRLVPWLHQHSKTYVAKFLLGRISNTDDSTGEVEVREEVPQISHGAIEAALQHFVGAIEQIPPQFSAVRVDGVRAYRQARRGNEIDLAPRNVHVHRISLRSWQSPELEVEVECGSGTYIRSLARDLGNRLGCGGLMSSLERTRIGPFQLDSAHKIEDLTRHNLANALIPMGEAIPEMPRQICTETEIAALIQGQKIPKRGGSPNSDSYQEICLVNENQQLLAIGILESGSEMLQPRAVFCVPRNDAKSSHVVT